MDNAMTTETKRLATFDGGEFWAIGGEVYRVKNPAVRDIYGLPQDKRWECSTAHWVRYRAVFSWATDVDASR
jgi:hypothetical protein